MSQWQATVDLLEACLGKLQIHAPLAAVKDLRQYLPTAPEGTHRLVLIELIKFDLAAAAEVGMNRRLFDYLNVFTLELPDAEVPPDLVLEELQILGEAGAEFDLDHYLHRFPHLAQELNNWRLRVDPPEPTLKPLGLNSRAVPELTIGDRIEDFRILRCVGRGGFASVYLALQETLQRLVALKVSRRGSEESQTLSQLDHPNIVRVYDERNPSDPPVRLLYMQFVGGGTMADCLKQIADIPITERRGSHLAAAIAHHLQQCGLEPSLLSDSVGQLNRLDWPGTVAWVGCQLSEGLDYAHRKSVIHRDIKPANILFAADGTPKLADFNVSYSGIAGRAGAAAYFGGSLAYMSPEQIEISLSTDGQRSADEMDGRSDLFSLGVVLWEMLHGTRPWSHAKRATSWTEALRNEHALRRQTPTAKSVAVQFHSHPSFRVLDHAIRMCLQVDPDQRPANGRQLKNMLRLGHHPRAAQRIFPCFGPVWQSLNRVPAWLVLLGGALVPNLVAAIFNFLYNSSQIVATYPDLWDTFLNVATGVNVLFFPIGIGLAVLLIVKHSQSLVAPMVSVRATRPTLGDQQKPEEFVRAGWSPSPEISLDIPRDSAQGAVAGFMDPAQVGSDRGGQNLAQGSPEATSVVTDRVSDFQESTARSQRQPVPNFAAKHDPVGVFSEGKNESKKAQAIDPPKICVSNVEDGSDKPNHKFEAFDPAQFMASTSERETVGSTKDSSARSTAPEFAWDLGHQIALICGVLWLSAGLVFPVLLLTTHHSFRWPDALHFFSSLTICGGVAMVYPFYWITCLNLALYYPRFVALRLHEPGIMAWGHRLRRLARHYLITAATIPLIALLLLVTAVEVPRHYLIITILTTAIGFAASLLAVQFIDDFVHDLEQGTSDRQP